jgi:hypothetical protein
MGHLHKLKLLRKLCPTYSFLGNLVKDVLPQNEVIRGNYRSKKRGFNPKESKRYADNNCE